MSFFAYLPISLLGLYFFSCLCVDFFFNFFPENPPPKKSGGEGIVYQMSITKHDLIPHLPEIGHFLNFTCSLVVCGDVFTVYRILYFVKN